MTTALERSPVPAPLHRGIAYADRSAERVARPLGDPERAQWSAGFSGIMDPPSAGVFGSRADDSPWSHGVTDRATMAQFQAAFIPPGGVGFDVANQWTAPDRVARDVLVRPELGRAVERVKVPAHTFYDASTTQMMAVWSLADATAYGMSTPQVWGTLIRSFGQMLSGLGTRLPGYMASAWAGVDGGVLTRLKRAMGRAAPTGAERVQTLLDATQDVGSSHDRIFTADAAIVVLGEDGGAPLAAPQAWAQLGAILARGHIGDKHGGPAGQRLRPNVHTSGWTTSAVVTRAGKTPVLLRAQFSRVDRRIEHLEVWTHHVAYEPAATPVS